jgi:hypothetical protein
MKNKYTAVLPLLLLILLFCSCQQRLYFPDRANTPGLTHALEGKATFSIKPQGNDADSGQADNANFGAGIDLAFSPVNHFGIIGSYRWINNRTIDENATANIFLDDKTIGGVFNGKRWELGAGYYDVFGKMGKVEVYGGYGNGSLERRGTELPQYNYNTRYHRFFIQPAMGFGRSKMFSFTGGLRFAFMKFYDFQSVDPTLKYSIGKSSQDVTSTIFPFIEPFVNFEGGYKFIKASVQFGASKQLINTNIAGNFPVYCSIGLIFHFSPEFFK